MTIERRALHAEYRGLDSKGKTFEAVVMAYDVVDDYGTIWTPGTFTDTLAARMPRIAWGHDWTDPLGRWVDAEDGRTTLKLKGEFDDFDAVPKARQASAQLQSGTIDQFSVGFTREEWQTQDQLTAADRSAGATERMTKSGLPEVSLVLMGAVPGTELVGMRGVRMSNGMTVPGDFVIDLGRKVSQGQITREEAAAAIDLVAGGKPEPEDETDTSAADTEANDEALAVLEALNL